MKRDKYTAMASVSARYPGIDFTNNDVDIATKFGVSREYVRQMRNMVGAAKVPRRVGRPPGYETKTVEQWIIDNKDKIVGMTVNQIYLSQTVKIRRKKLVGLLNKHGASPLHAGRIHPWELMNWDLPNSVLVKLWLGPYSPSRYNTLNRARKKYGHPPKHKGWDKALTEPPLSDIVKEEWKKTWYPAKL